jgi:hypothetical protein
MSKDPRDEALDKIQDLATWLAASGSAPANVREGLRIIEALARHRDIPDCLNQQDTELLTKIRRANETGILPDETDY